MYIYHKYIFIYLKLLFWNTVFEIEPRVQIFPVKRVLCKRSSATFFFHSKNRSLTENNLYLSQEFRFATKSFEIAKFKKSRAGLLIP